MCLICSPNPLLSVFYNPHVKPLRQILPRCSSFVESCTHKHAVELGCLPSQRHNASRSTLIRTLCNLLKLLNRSRYKAGHILVLFPHRNGPGRSRLARGRVHCITVTQYVQVNAVLAAEKTSRAPHGCHGPLGQTDQTRCQDWSLCILISLQNLERRNLAQCCRLICMHVFFPLLSIQSPVR